MLIASGSRRIAVLPVLLGLAALSLGVLVPIRAALAWKPITHVYFAEQARLDAIDDGRVTIWATDFDSGTLKRDAQGNPVKIGDYPVDPVVLNALRSCPAQFRAGTLGPDAYPDIMTGQQVIHPAGRNTPGEPADMDLNPNGPGSNPWLEYLWSRAYRGADPDGLHPNPADRTPQTQAFVLGYLSHAAGDMYGHTFMNYFTGGPFHFMPRPENAVKHVVLEGYVFKRTPALGSYDASIDGVDGFLYRNMIDARPQTYLAAHLLRGDNTRFSLPYIFSALRVKLQADIDAYYAKVNDYEARRKAKLDEAANCAPTNFHCSRVLLTGEAAAILTEEGGFRATNGPWVTYEEHWRDDIDAGLAALPMLSHRIALALMFNAEGKTDVDAARQIAHEYGTQHLISMAGAPDFVGFAMAKVDAVIDALGIPALQDAIHQMKADLFNYLLVKATGISVADLKNYASNPETYFEPILNSAQWNTEGTGHPVALQTFNAQQLHIQDPGAQNMGEKFDLATFAAGHNSTTMIKLLMMSPDGVNQLLRDLGAAANFTGSNAMLGFIETLDGSNQWKANPARMPLAADENAYRKIFMRQVAFGEDAAANPPPTPNPTPTPTPNPPAPSAPFAIDPAHVVTLRNSVTHRLLLANGSTIGAAGAEGGWLSSPTVVEADANYYDLTRWALEPNGEFFMIRNTKTGRLLLSPGSEVNTAGAEGGWLQSPHVLGVDANYYDRAMWSIQRANGGFLITNKADHRLLFSTAEPVSTPGAEGGWLKSAPAVAADANYYNRAIWELDGPGAALVP